MALFTIKGQKHFKSKLLARDASIVYNFYPKEMSMHSDILLVAVMIMEILKNLTVIVKYISVHVQYVSFLK